MMKSRIIYTLFLLMTGVFLFAGDLSYTHFTGYGSDTVGGSGGTVIKVTSLKNFGPGTLHEALHTKVGPRIIVFEVAGVINLEKHPLIIGQPFVTIAGQTAPSPGITIISAGIEVNSHDVIIQHLHVRPGDAGEKPGSGWDSDGICARGKNAYNVVIDHCSVSWAVDENLSTSGLRTEGPEYTAHKVTISNCIIAEGLSHASHYKGEHSKGSLIHDYCRDIAVVGNLYAHNMERNPYFKAHTTGVIINNLIYNSGTTAIKLNWQPDEWKHAKLKPDNCNVSIVGNVWIMGINTVKNKGMIGFKGNAFIEDNLPLTIDNKPAELLYGDVVLLPEKPSWQEGFEALPSAEVMEYVLKNVGARPKDRDQVDQRIVQTVIDRTGKIIDSQNDVGGYPRMFPKRRKLDVPETNVDEWLAQFTKEVEY